MHRLSAIRPTTVCSPRFAPVIAVHIHIANVVRRSPESQGCAFIQSQSQLLFAPHSRSGLAHALESYAALWPPITSSGLAFLMLPRRDFYSLTLTRCEAGSRREIRAQVITLRLPPFGCCGLTALVHHLAPPVWLNFSSPHFCGDKPHQC